MSIYDSFAIFFVETNLVDIKKLYVMGGMSNVKERVFIRIYTSVVYRQSPLYEKADAMGTSSTM